MTTTGTASPLLRQRALVDGDWIGAASGAEVEVVDPATGRAIGAVPRFGRDDTRAAIASCARALPGWRERSGHERAEILRRWAQSILDERESLAELLSLEQGKPLAEARIEVGSAAAYVQFYAEEAKRLAGEVLSHPARDKRIVVLRQSVGVTAGITPWNWPIGMPARKVASALAAGCTMVLKPAEQTPFSALALGELGLRAGLPGGVLNVVTGAAEDAPVIGSEIMADPVVRAVSFTGSTEVGKLLVEQSAATLTRVTLELGGNAPFIVFDDADLALAVREAVGARFRNAGQVCIAANRILVQEGIFDRFAEAFAAETARLRVGPAVEGADVGPLIDETAVRKVETHLADALGRGARLVLGGSRDERGGTFFQPSVVLGVDDSMLMSREETFGPVAGLRSFRTEREAVEIANATPFGLAAYLFTSDGARGGSPRRSRPG